MFLTRCGVFVLLSSVIFTCFCQEYDFEAEIARQCLVPDPVGLLDCVENKVTLPYLVSWVDCTNSLGQNVRTSADIINYRCKSVWEGKGVIPEVIFIKDCVIEKTGLPAKNVSAEVLGAYKECESTPQPQQQGIKTAPVQQQQLRVSSVEYGTRSPQFQAPPPSQQFQALPPPPPSQQFKAPPPSQQFKAPPPSQQFKAPPPSQQFKAPPPSQQFQALPPPPPSRQFQALPPPPPSRQFQAPPPPSQQFQALPPPPNQQFQALPPPTQQFQAPVGKTPVFNPPQNMAPLQQFQFSAPRPIQPQMPAPVQRPIQQQIQVLPPPPVQQASYRTSAPVQQQFAPYQVPVAQYQRPAPISQQYFAIYPQAQLRNQQQNVNNPNLSQKTAAFVPQQQILTSASQVTSTNLNVPYSYAFQIKHPLKPVL